MIKSLRFNTENEFFEFMKYKKEIGFGSEATCFLLCKDVVLKHFNGVPHKEYVEKDLLQYKDLDIDTYYFGKATLHIENDLKGYLTEYAPGKRIDEINFEEVNLNDLLLGLKKYFEDTKILSDKQIVVDDVYDTNILFDGDKLRIIDTCGFSNLDDYLKLLFEYEKKGTYTDSIYLKPEDVYKYNTHDFTFYIFDKIVKKEIKKLINNDKNLLELKNDFELIQFIELLNLKLNDLCDGNFTKISDAKSKLKKLK